MTKEKKPVTIKQDEVYPEPMEVIAASIIEISAAVKKLNSSRVKARVIYLLIKDATNIPLGTIEAVLNAAQSLEKTYLK